ncbi:SipW-dependent-type signal peptide-containing protein [Natronobeatus ordinarius]|uniref:SipW-dependent-type signal peptide-containing protein n=1 Tax=Natronobeatus ordinarius TaxID=2963433 RepID=UPI0020CC6AAA|nr:SipW-dependent-type signal peptide-containing protein [Natronobeatus ordinarius]
MPNDFELTRRKALAGIGAIGAASVGAGLGTSAYFSDRETFDGNTLTAGELDLRIDWQQLYFGPEANAHHYAPYGKAGYPYVNAHPDHDTTGEQSLDSDDFDSVPDHGVVRYSDEDANIQEYLTCETLENFEAPDDFDNGVGEPQSSLIELEDVKPGDCGEVTFSLHLCDNPGYIWWIGQVNEFDHDLAKAIKVKAWYDLGCTNEFDEEDGDKILVECTDLHTFVQDRLTPNGRFLNPNVYDGAGVGGDDALDGEPEIDCRDLDKIEFEEDGPVMEHGEILDVFVEDGELKLVALFRSPDGDVEILVQFSELIYKDEDDNEVLATSEDEIDWEEIVEYDWDILDSYDGYETTDDAGMCEKTIKSGTAEETSNLITSLGCTTGQTNVRTPGTGPQQQPQGISHIEFRYCASEAPPLCFPEEETFCVAFEWCLPTSTPEHVDDINDLQGQSISFDLGFYTEQCRHNSNPSGPSGFV